MLNRTNKNYILVIFFAVIFVISAIWTASIPRIETGQLLTGFFISFLLYLLIMLGARSYSFYILFIIAVVARCGLIFLFPELSDDIYRFYWDGKLMTAGINPYGILPTSVSVSTFFPSEGWLLSAMNSPGYFTVYPPILQGLFLVGACGDDIYEFNIILKVLFILVECAGFYYLSKYLENNGLDRKNALWYFLNPLVIIEGIGNLHAEVVMMASLSIFIFFWKKGMMAKASVFFSVAVAIKLTPLMLIPFLWFSQQKSKLTFFLGAFLTTVLLFTPLWISGKWLSYAQSLDLYFRTFEFNGSVYYILREIGIWWKGYNLIAITGPLLGAISMILIIWQSWKSRNTFQITGFSIIAWFTYLMLATTVHPWYILPLLFFTSIHGISVAVLWSAAIFLTYINYGNQPFREDMWIVILEYSLILGYILINYKDIFSKIKIQPE